MIKRAELLKEKIEYDLTITHLRNASHGNLHRDSQHASLTNSIDIGDRLGFVKRHFSDSVVDNGVTRVCSLIVCVEKPDVAYAVQSLENIIEEAPLQLKSYLRNISALQHEIDAAHFKLKMKGMTHLLTEKATHLHWTPSDEALQGLFAKRLFSNSQISTDETWPNSFVQQVKDIRLCHIRHISKKGCDLEGRQHFESYLLPEGHPSAKGRTKAAMEVLSRADITTQARSMIKQALELCNYQNRNSLTIHCLRAVKDYDDKSNSYNYLTVTYAQLLRNKMLYVAKTDYPNLNIRIVDLPVMMLTHTNRTDSSLLGRLVKQPYFKMGNLDNKFVLVIDDHVNAGAFTSTMISQATEHGAHVVGVATFSRHPNSSDLRLNLAVRSALCTLSPQQEIDILLDCIGLSLNTLTNREGLILLSMLMDGHNDLHSKIFDSVMSTVNGQYNYLLEGVGDDLNSEFRNRPETPRSLLAKITQMFKDGRVR